MLGGYRTEVGEKEYIHSVATKFASDVMHAIVTLSQDNTAFQIPGGIDASAPYANYIVQW